MADVSRRKFLAVAAAATGTVAVTPSAEAATTDARRFDNAQAMLYDATRCIGCRSCMRACRQINRLPPDEATLHGVEYDLPERLSANNWMVIQTCRRPADAATEAPSDWTFVNKHCMHCNVPACASACPVAALAKTEEGPVVYHEDRCIGCRYCLMACPYQVPRYEWVEAVPRVRKCMFMLACVDACPVGALQKGSRGELLEEAHRRIREEPDRYVDHVYGEDEAGGTGYLILSAVPFEDLGLPNLPPMTRSHYAESILESIPGLIIGMGLFLGGLYQLEKRQHQLEEAIDKRRLTPSSEDRLDESRGPENTDH